MSNSFLLKPVKFYIIPLSFILIKTKLNKVNITTLYHYIKMHINANKNNIININPCGCCKYSLLIMETNELGQFIAGI